MLNKEKILEKVRVNADSKQIAIRIIDLASQVLKKHEPAFSDFMSPQDQDVASRVLSQIPDLQHMFFGGYDDAEYMMLGLFPDWMVYDTSDFPISIVDVTLKEAVDHREVLGSVLGLGIKREKIGDLVIYDQIVQIVSETAMADFVSMHLTRIGRHKASSEVKSIVFISPKEPEYESFSTTVKSLRLDSIIAAGFNISRGKASDLIRQERVKVNYRYTTSVSIKLNPGDLISVRGKGRIVYAGDEGTTRKERIRVELKRVK